MLFLFPSQFNLHNISPLNVLPFLLAALLNVDSSPFFIVLSPFRMANQGRTIIMSIHQPRYSIYRLFDSLTLLVSGKQVYHGPAQNALDYFADIGNLQYQYYTQSIRSYRCCIV